MIATMLGHSGVHEARQSQEMKSQGGPAENANTYALAFCSSAWHWFLLAAGWPGSCRNRKQRGSSQGRTPRGVGLLSPRLLDKAGREGVHKQLVLQDQHHRNPTPLKPHTKRLAPLKRCFFNPCLIQPENMPEGKALRV